MSGRRSSRSDGRPASRLATQILMLEVAPERQVGRHRLPQQQHQRVLVLRRLPRIERQVRLRLIQRRLGLAHAQQRRVAALELRVRQVVGLLLAGDRILRDLEQRLVGQHRQVCRRHLRHQADLRAPRRLRLREILLERLRRQAAQPAEQIQLVRREPKTRRCSIDTTYAAPPCSTRSSAPPPRPTMSCRWKPRSPRRRRRHRHRRSRCSGSSYSPAACRNRRSRSG